MVIGILLCSLVFGLVCVVLLKVLNLSGKSILLHYQATGFQGLTLVIMYVVFFQSLLLLINLTVGLSSAFTEESVSFYFFGTVFTFLVDGLSILFILLTTFIFPFCAYSVRTDVKNPELYYFLLLLLEFLLLVVFTTTDLLLFYIFFESTLIPMILITGIWGSRPDRKRAAFYLFLYTLIGSFFMLIAIICLYLESGTTNMAVIMYGPGLTSDKQKFLWFCFFIAFAVKIPIVPFHLWLPEAHVEAPTVGSVILASLLLKLGGYGFIRMSLGMFPIATIYFSPLVYTLCLVSIIYASFIALRQTDIKKIIAYSSIAHMNIAVLGLFTGGVLGVQGAIVLMVGHGLVSGALFFCIGILYDRYNTREVAYYGGLIQSMPLFSLFFVFFNVANLGFPGLSNFIGEILVIMGVFNHNTTAASLAALTMVLSAAYSLWLVNRICFGAPKEIYLSKLFSGSDVNLQELLILVPFVMLIIIFGIYPQVLLDVTSSIDIDYFK